MLELGEVRIQGDEFNPEPDVWVLSDRIGTRMEPRDMGRYRRRRIPAPAPAAPAETPQGKMCILDQYEPLYPPSDEQRRQCGCVQCLKDLANSAPTETETPVNYNAPTPKTDAFMSLIDDSEIDLRQVKSFCATMECDLSAAQSALKAMTEEKECWLFNARELQKQVNGAEPERAKMVADLAAAQEQRDAAYAEQSSHADQSHEVEAAAKDFPESDTRTASKWRTESSPNTTP